MKPPGRPEQQDPLWIEEVLHAEAAANVRRMQANALWLDLEDELRELAADSVHTLPRQLEVERVARRVIARDAGPRFERHDDYPVVHHLDLDDVSRLFHRGGRRLTVAALHVIHEVARRLVPQDRCAGPECGTPIDHGRQRLVIDIEQLGRRPCDVGTVSHDEGDGIADMPRPPGRERRPRRHDHRVDCGKAGQCAEAVSREIRARRDQPHPRQSARLRSINRTNQRVRMRRA